MSEASPYARQEQGLPPILIFHPCLSVAGTKYTIAFSLSVVSSYANGNPWSVVFGGATTFSGIGAAAAWAQYKSHVTCGTTAASNLLEFRLASQTNRAASLLIDNVVATVGWT